MAIFNQYQHYQQDNLKTNPLAVYWKSMSCPKAVGIPIIYTAGMIGYGLSLPIRIIKTVVDALALVGAFFYMLFTCCCNPNAVDFFKKRSFILGADLIEVASAIVGIACPIIAYKIDAWIESYTVVQQSFLFCCKEGWNWKLYDVFTRQPIHFGLHVNPEDLQQDVGNIMHFHGNQQNPQYGVGGGDAVGDNDPRLQQLLNSQSATINTSQLKQTYEKEIELMKIAKKATSYFMDEGEEVCIGGMDLIYLYTCVLYLKNYFEKKPNQILRLLRDETSSNDPSVILKQQEQWKEVDTYLEKAEYQWNILISSKDLIDAGISKLDAYKVLEERAQEILKILLSHFGSEANKVKGEAEITIAKANEQTVKNLHQNALLIEEKLDENQKAALIEFKALIIKINGLISCNARIANQAIFQKAME